MLYSNTTLVKVKQKLGFCSINYKIFIQIKHLLKLNLKAWLKNPQSQPEIEEWYQTHYKMFE